MTMYQNTRKQLISTIAFLSVIVLMFSLLLHTPGFASAKSAVVFGDVDGDGSVSTNDALTVLQGVTGKIQFTDNEVFNADVDNCAGASASDALIILQYVTKKVNEFPKSLEENVFSWKVTMDEEFTDGSSRYDGTATITGYTGSSLIVDFPEVVTDEDGGRYKVTAIGNGSRVVAGMKDVRKISLPDGLEQIMPYAFCECKNITGSLYIPKTVEAIGSFAFRGCAGLTGSLDIQKNVISVGDYAFAGCEGFNGALSINCASVGRSAFSGCRGFVTLTINANVKNVSNNAFADCSGLTGEVEIPKTLRSIGEGAFKGSGVYRNFSISVSSLLKDNDDIFEGFNGQVVYY